MKRAAQPVQCSVFYYEGSAADGRCLQDVTAPTKLP